MRLSSLLKSSPIVQSNATDGALHEDREVCREACELAVWVSLRSETLGSLVYLQFPGTREKLQGGFLEGLEVIFG